MLQHVEQLDDMVTGMSEAQLIDRRARRFHPFQDRELQRMHPRENGAETR